MQESQIEHIAEAEQSLHGPEIRYGLEVLSEYLEGMAKYLEPTEDIADAVVLLLEATEIALENCEPYPVQPKMNRAARRNAARVARNKRKAKARRKR